MIWSVGSVAYVVFGLSASSNTWLCILLRSSSGLVGRADPNTTYATLPTDEINYIRNSVKADGRRVRRHGDALRVGRATDPILQAWEEVFPGIGPAEGGHPRRSCCSTCATPRTCSRCSATSSPRYHVDRRRRRSTTGNDRWEVPRTRETHGRTAAAVPPLLRTRAGGESRVVADRRLRAARKGKNLAAYIAVNSDATSSDYGKIRCCSCPSNTQVRGPLQIANTFATNEDVSQALLPYTTGDADRVPATC